MPTAESSTLDTLIKQGRTILYHPRLNRLTGSRFASILLGQIYYYWRQNGRQPFYKYTLPCPSARPGDSWTEELDCSRHELEKARRAIATKVKRGASRKKALQASPVIYWTDSQRRTWYQVNEPLLFHLLVGLDDERSEDGLDPPQPADCAPNVTNQRYICNAKNQHDTDNAEEELYPVTPASAVTCTQKTTQNPNRENGAGGADMDLVAALARLGDSDPVGLLAHYPASQVRGWLAYCRSPAGLSIHNKPGFIRSRLKQNRAPPPQRRQATIRKRSAAPTAEPAPPDPPPRDPAGERLERLWREVQDELRLQMTVATFDLWLRETWPLELSDGLLRVSVPHAHVKDWLDHRLRPTIDRTLAYLAPDLSVAFVVLAEDELPPASAQPSALPSAPALKSTHGEPK